MHDASTAAREDAARLTTYFRGAMTEYRRHIAMHWPARDQGDLHECNLSLHLALQMARDGALIYQEVYVQSIRRTIDLLVLDLDRRCAFAVEAKRIKENGSISSLADQAERLSWLRLSSGTSQNRRLPDVRCHAVLLAHAWYASGRVVAKWWTSDRAPTAPCTGFGSKGDWARLRAFLDVSVTDSIDVTVKAPHTCMLAARSLGPGTLWE